VTVKPSKFFGPSIIKTGQRNVHITDPEKTIVDCLDKPKYCGGIIEVMKDLKNAKFDWEMWEVNLVKVLLSKLKYIAHHKSVLASPL